jgi:peptide deformylase
MAVRPVVKHGHRVLNGNLPEITEVTPELIAIVDDMIDTMREGDPPGVGLAGPQIGEALRVIVAEPPPDHEGDIAVYRDAVVLLNPQIVMASGREVIEEGCLSCPGVTADVERPSHVVVAGLNVEGQPVKLEVTGALARIFQHEIDHLHGRFFFDHLNPLKRQLVKARIRRT